MRFTHHVVGDGCSYDDRDDAVGEEVSEDLGQEVDGGAVVAARVLVAATDNQRQRLSRRLAL